MKSVLAIYLLVFSFVVNAGTRYDCDMFNLLDNVPMHGVEMWVVVDQDVAQVYARVVYPNATEDLQAILTKKAEYFSGNSSEGEEVDFHLSEKKEAGVLSFRDSDSINSSFITLCY